jgi:hypothetical protein
MAVCPVKMSQAVHLHKGTYMFDSWWLFAVLLTGGYPFSLFAASAGLVQTRDKIATAGFVMFQEEALPRIACGVVCDQRVSISRASLVA